jgi:hypothetical protein
MKQKGTVYCIVAYAANSEAAGWHMHTTSLKKVDEWQRKPLQTFVSADGCQRRLLREKGNEEWKLIPLLH